MSDTLLVLIITSLACSMIGVFLVLRNLAMVSDAIAHSILLGIVLAFFITHDLSSPLLIIGAGVFGVLTVFCIDMFMRSKLIKEDSAVGIVFPLFFSLAVILISKYARNVHIDTDMVLMGEVIYAPLNRVSFLGFDLPKAVVYMGIMLIVNLIFIFIFYKELKITTFDKDYAVLAGFSLPIIYYILMTLVSVTSVVAFDSVGAILVISFLITPCASAYLITDELKKTFIFTAVYALINSVIGYYLSIYFNVSMSGMCATVAGINFFLTFLFNPNGVITSIALRKNKKLEFQRELLIIHLGNHLDGDYKAEHGFESIYLHLNWNKQQLEMHIKYLIDKGVVKEDNSGKYYYLTEEGEKINQGLREIFGI